MVSADPEPLYQIGQYQCTTSVNLDLLGDVFAGHFQSTAYNINATLKYMVLNLHAASSAEQPGVVPVPSLSQLPSPSEYIAGILNISLSSYLYIPDTLDRERANLNSSWFAASSAYQPNYAYFHTTQLPSGILATSDGWPSESYIVMLRAQRLLVGYGTVDPQISGYNVMNDAQTIFEPGLFMNLQDTVLSSTGNVTSGCFFDSGSTSISTVNNSFAVSENNFLSNPLSSLSTVYADSNAVTSCGLSPLLNETLGNVTADVNITEYAGFARGAIWAWALNQPKDAGSVSSTTTDSSNSDNHCAALNMTNNGKWEVTSCNARQYGACRVAQTPYDWTISTQAGAYDAVSRACPENSSFSVPATALENAYLRSAIQNAMIQGTLGDSDIMYWVNFNDLDVSGCWVSGINNTCPYVQGRIAQGGSVIVPTVAAVVVFVLAGLTLFVKCASNRGQTRRRRKRADNGWDYEGVPS